MNHDLALYYKIPDLNGAESQPMDHPGWGDPLNGLGELESGPSSTARRAAVALWALVAAVCRFLLGVASVLLRVVKAYLGVGLFIAAGIASVASVVLTMSNGRSGGASFAGMAVLLWFVAAPVMLVRMLAEQLYAHEKVGPVVDSVCAWCVAAWASCAEAAAIVAGLFGA